MPGFRLQELLPLAAMLMIASFVVHKLGATRVAFALACAAGFVAVASLFLERRGL